MIDILLSMQVQSRNGLIAKYTNWRGETSVRRIQPTRLYFGTTEYHTEPQWLLEAFDLDKREGRTFALQNLVVDGAEVVSVPTAIVVSGEPTL